MTVKFTILGCGYSLGVPRIDGSFGKCNPYNKKNYRTRCSALIRSKNINILIDISSFKDDYFLVSFVVYIIKYTNIHKNQRWII